MARVVVTPPGKTIGILGGGQLGRMFAIAARRMGYRVHALDPAPDCPTGQVADVEWSAPYDDVDTAGKYRLRRLGLAASPPDTTVRLMVVGHTHRARIVVAEEQDREARRRPATGDALILMDCGAWNENATFADEHGRPRTTASAQIGVQCGSDVRIYQCDLGATS